MTVSATDTPASIIVTENGTPGAAGADGTDGIGFNGVRKSLIDNPLSWLYKNNNIVNILNQLLTVERPSTGNYTDIYGVAQVAAIDEPREEVTGWLIDSTETHSFNLYNNVPYFDNGFSCVLRVGSYSAGAVNQKIFTVPGSTGDLFSIGTDGVGNWLVTLRGSDDVEYEASTSISATSSESHTVIVNYDGSDANVYIDNSLSGNVTIPTGLTQIMDYDGVVSLSGNFTVNLEGLRFYPFILNDDELTYIND